MAGIVRGLNNGRLVIPKETLQAANINNTDNVVVYSEQNADGQPTIVIRKYFSGCTLCGELIFNSALSSEFMGKRICSTCMENLQHLQVPKKPPKEES